MTPKIHGVTRRAFIELITAGPAAALAFGLPEQALAATHKDVLVIGMDISDTVTFDPAREAQYTAPMTLEATYNALLTMNPGNYIDLQPSLATTWGRTPNGKGWRMAMRKGVKFNSGNMMTIEDVKWSFDRLLNLRGQPALYVSNITGVSVADSDHIDILLRDPDRPILDILCSPTFPVYDRRVLAAHGGVAGPDAATKDTATSWLDQHSCGTGAYTLVGWERNARIELVRNPYYWGTKAFFERVVILHFSESATQLLAVERGTIDAAFNLIPEQLVSLKGSKSVRVDRLESLDFVYMALTAYAGFNKALAVQEARQAVGYAIDYDGIRDKLLGGAAVRPATFLPIGVLGSTPEIAAKVGFRQDLDKSKALLQKAGFPDGFSFKLSYGTAAIGGIAYSLLAEYVQADLARVGIKVILDPLDQVTMRTQYLTAHSTAVITYWNPPAVDNWLWAAASIRRVAKRVRWDPPASLGKLVNDAADEQTRDRTKSIALWTEYQKQMVEYGNLIVLFQPIYRIAVRDRIKIFPLTAAGWQLDIADVT
ncbi:MAG: ABC transporter substrate-binding protein [Stellaceae bacterium]